MIWWCTFTLCNPFAKKVNIFILQHFFSQKCSILALFERCIGVLFPKFLKLRWFAFKNDFIGLIARSGGVLSRCEVRFRKKSIFFILQHFFGQKCWFLAQKATCCVLVVLLLLFLLPPLPSRKSSPPSSNALRCALRCCLSLCVQYAHCCAHVPTADMKQEPVKFSFQIQGVDGRPIWKIEQRLFSCARFLRWVQFCFDAYVTSRSLSDGNSFEGVAS